MSTNPSLTETAWSQCEAVIRQFEDAWRTGRPRDVGAFVPADYPLRARLLVELVHVDLEFRLRANEDARVEDYLDRFPELTGKDLTLDLIAAEYALRARHRPPVSPAEFWLRFPKHEADLRTLLTASAPHHGFMMTREASAEVAPPLTGPPLIPGCQIQGELGRGGMGIVYKARDLLLNRNVAVKTVGSVPSPEARARFAREAESIARLDHPRIVPVYDVGEWGPDGGPKVPFFTMKWYSGGSLDSVPSGPGTDPAVHARLIETIATAVHHAHRRGVLHLDLKPSNILLDDSGEPHVADFGLAGWFDPADPRSVLGGAVGTPAFMAPEQARPAGRVTLAADVYGIGAVMYHLLTGRPPFLAPTAMGTLELVMNAPPQRPSSINAAVPSDLEAVCLKCLDKDPAKRYATAEEIADDLARWRTGRPVLARPARVAERTWLMLRRHPLLSGMASVTFAALVAAIVVLSVSNDQIRKKEREAQTALERELEAQHELRASLDREQWSLYLARVAEAGRLYQMNHLEQAWNTLDLCPVKHQNWEWNYLHGLRRVNPVVFRRPAGSSEGLAYLADGRAVEVGRSREVRVWHTGGTGGFNLLDVPASRIATHPTRNLIACGSGASVTIWDVDRNRSLRQVPGDGWSGFSPNGALFASVKDSVVQLWKVETWEPAGELKGHKDTVTVGAFTQDGRAFYTGARDRTVRVWDLDTRQPVGEPWKRPLPLMDLALTADGKLLIEAMQSRLQVTDAVTGQPVRNPEVAPTWPCVVCGPDPTWFATNTLTGEVVVRHAAAGHVLRTYRGHKSTVDRIALNRVGTQLASSDGDGTTRIADATTTPEFTDLVTEGDSFGPLSITSDRGRLLVTPRGFRVSGSVRVIDLATRKELLKLAASGEAAMDPAGRWLVMGSAKNDLVLVDAGTGTVTKTLAVRSAATRVRVSPDGRRLAVADADTSQSIRVRVWDTGTWTASEPLTQSDDPLTAVAWSPTGEQLAVTKPHGVELWSVTSRTLVRSIPTAQPPVAVAFGPAGDTLAIAGRSRLLTIHDANTGQLIRPFIGNPVVIKALAFHPRGNRLAAAGADGRVRLWDIASGQEVLVLPAGDKDLSGVVWSGDGQQLIASGGVVRSWSIP